jgi:predicted outer membrane protein
MKTYVAVAALMASLATPAAAQMMGPPGAPVPPGAGVPAGPAVPLTDETFRIMSAQSDAFEIASSQLALQRSRNPRVRAFAQRMIVDHSATSQALNGGQPVYGPGGQILTEAGTDAALGAGIGFLAGGPIGAAVGAGVGAATGTTVGAASAAAAPIRTVVPLNPQQSAMLNQLAATSGPRFDSLYGRFQVMAHQQALALNNANLQSPETDFPLKRFSQQVIPSLQQHLAMASGLPGAPRARVSRLER